MHGRGPLEPTLRAGAGCSDPGDWQRTLNRVKAKKNDAFLRSQLNTHAQCENSGGADATLSQAAKAPEAGGESRGGPRGGGCAYRSRLPPTGRVTT
jgi:hypothetical protein